MIKLHKWAFKSAKAPSWQGRNTWSRMFAIRLHSSLPTHADAAVDKPLRVDRRSKTLLQRYNPLRSPETPSGFISMAA